MVIRVDAELLQESFSNHLNISYTLEENKKNNVVQDVSGNCRFRWRWNSLGKKFQSGVATSDDLQIKIMALNKIID